MYTYINIYIYMYIHIHTFMYLYVYINFYICIQHAMRTFKYHNMTTERLKTTDFSSADTGNVVTVWRRPIRCLQLQVIFRKRAKNYRALLRKTTYKDRASYGSSPPFIYQYTCIDRYVTRV